MSWRQLRWAAAITRDCLSTITGGSRSSIRRMASIWGQEDLQATDLNAIRAAGLRLGVSTHDDMEIDVALAARPSYIALGHVFPTQTKQMPSAPQRLEQLARHVERLADYPTVAIGGVSLARAPAVIATGVGSIAVVSAITQAADWRLATAQLLEIAGSWR